jgi:Regulator of chromosome condensation (RCC1) repeat
MVWIWGDNKKSELGLGDSARRDAPFPLCSLKDKPVCRIFAGKSYTVVIVGR